MKAFKKKKQLIIKEPPIVEPVRKSLLNVLKNNLQLFNRTIFVHRIFYLGEHKFESPSEFFDEFQSSMNSLLNTGYNDENFSGLLLYYNIRFCHMIEGSEFLIMKHLHLIFENSKLMEKMGRMKLVLAVHHINQRFYDKWHSYHSQPPVRIEEIDSESDIETTTRYVKNFIRKFYGLARELYVTVVPSASSSQSDLLKRPSMRPSNSPQFEIGQREVTIENLPEVKLIDFLLGTKYLADLRTFYDLYFNIPQKDNYNDFAWPVPSDFIPYNIFTEAEDLMSPLPARASLTGVLQDNETESQRTEV